MKTEVLNRKIRARKLNTSGNGFLTDRTIERAPLSNTRKRGKLLDAIFGMTIF